MNKTILCTPLSDKAVRSLRTGDVFYLDGVLVTARDDVHIRHLRQGIPLPAELRDLAIFHAGPIMKPRIERLSGAADKEWDVISIGPTTSMRMENAEAEFIAATGIKLIVGKGGMGQKTADACKRYGAVHAVFPGGCAVLAAGQVKKVERVEWLDLGMPEALWVLNVKEFGPLIVSIDCEGNNLFEKNKIEFAKRKDAALANLRGALDFHP
jgi:L(+)-tartrate dehydratase beta subunit